MIIIELLQILVKEKGSDLHLLTNTPICIRKNGELLKISEPMTKSEINSMIKLELLKDEKIFNKFIKEKEYDYSFSVKNLGRFRVNLSIEKNSIAGVFRYIPEHIPSLEQLKSPDILNKIISNNKGLVLVTGPTGTGKSTTLAAMINEINITQAKKIITIEDPIEFIHQSKKSIIAQRSVGFDTNSFADGLKHILRQDPDIILIGEIRDKISAEIAIKAASTGHLVFSTLHTNSASETILRILDMFSFEEAKNIKEQLATNLIAIISQELVPKIDNGRIAVEEILYNNEDIKDLIRKERFSDIYSYMQSNDNHLGFTQTQRLQQLINEHEITMEIGLKYSHHKEEFKRNIY